MLEEMMPRWVPTENVNGFEICPGLYRDEGATAFQSAVNFTVHSKGAVTCELLLFHRKEPEPYAVIPFPENCRIGDVFSMMVFGLDIEEFEYAYRLDGPWKPKEGLLFDKKHILLDPYAKAVTGQSVWGKALNTGGYRARVVRNNFFWGSEKPDKIPMEKLIIYEMHVRGFTKMDKSVRHPGTFAGIKEKIPYLKTLGINAVELMPIFEFDELQGSREVDGKKLIDYWGYNTVSFFAPNTSYAASTEYNREGVELKELIRELHDNQIEVILDVVFNHTAEGNECGPFISFKGFDNQIYYMLTPDGKYYNFSGCGNTVNCNHPVVIKMIQDCLRYWVAEYRVDGFRFDLASILGRNEDGSPMENPPLVKNLAYDSLLADTKLIAEAWDAGGLYQVGSFPSWKRWAEWNGRYRDDMRRFLKGDDFLAQTAAARITGSPDLYDPAYRGGNASINFLTCHDGFTLCDLYSYNQKHNEANGWGNTDGADDNNSWNCGVEGETNDSAILVLRKRLMKNACAVLLCSRGTPMFLSGDEFADTRYGNNNPYCQDNLISWLDWSLLKKNKDLFDFFQYMIQFRKDHPAIRKDLEPSYLGIPAMSTHGLTPDETNFSGDSHVVCVRFAGYNEATQEEDLVYLAVNSGWFPVTLTLPELPEKYKWHVAVNTGDPKCQFFHKNSMPTVESKIFLGERSVIILIATVI